MLGAILGGLMFLTAVPRGLGADTQGDTDPLPVVDDVSGLAAEENRVIRTDLEMHAFLRAFFHGIRKPGGVWGTLDLEFAGTEEGWQQLPLRIGSARITAARLPHGVALTSKEGDQPPEILFLGIGPYKVQVDLWIPTRMGDSQERVAFEMPTAIESEWVIDLQGESVPDGLGVTAESMPGEIPGTRLRGFPDEEGRVEVSWLKVPRALNTAPLILQKIDVVAHAGMQSVVSKAKIALEGFGGGLPGQLLFTLPQGTNIVDVVGEDVAGWRLQGMTLEVALVPGEKRAVTLELETTTPVSAVVDELSGETEWEAGLILPDAMGMMLKRDIPGVEYARPMQILQPFRVSGSLTILPEPGLRCSAVQTETKLTSNPSAIDEEKAGSPAVRYEFTDKRGPWKIRLATVQARREWQLRTRIMPGKRGGLEIVREVVTRQRQGVPTPWVLEFPANETIQMPVGGSGPVEYGRTTVRGGETTEAKRELVEAFEVRSVVKMDQTDGGAENPHETVFSVSSPVSQGIGEIWRESVEILPDSQGRLVPEQMKGLNLLGIEKGTHFRLEARGMWNAELRYEPLPPAVQLSVEGVLTGDRDEAWVDGRFSVLVLGEAEEILRLRLRGHRPRDLEVWGDAVESVNVTDRVYEIRLKEPVSGQIFLNFRAALVKKEGWWDVPDFAMEDGRQTGGNWTLKVPKNLEIEIRAEGADLLETEAIDDPKWNHAAVLAWQTGNPRIGFKPSSEGEIQNAARPVVQYELKTTFDETGVQKQRLELAFSKESEDGLLLNLPANARYIELRAGDQVLPVLPEGNGAIRIPIEKSDAEGEQELRRVLEWSEPMSAWGAGGMREILPPSFEEGVEVTQGNWSLVLPTQRRYSHWKMGGQRTGEWRKAEDGVFEAAFVGPPPPLEFFQVREKDFHYWTAGAFILGVGLFLMGVRRFPWRWFLLGAVVFVVFPYLGWQQWSVPVHAMGVGWTLAFLGWLVRQLHQGRKTKQLAGLAVFVVMAVQGIPSGNLKAAEPDLFTDSSEEPSMIPDWVINSAFYDLRVVNGTWYVRGRLDLRKSTDRYVAVPMGMEGLRFHSLFLDGKPAGLNQGRVVMEGEGTHEIIFEATFERRGVFGDFGFEPAKAVAVSAIFQAPPGTRLESEPAGYGFEEGDRFFLTPPEGEWLRFRVLAVPMSDGVPEAQLAFFRGSLVVYRDYESLTGTWKFEWPEGSSDSASFELDSNMVMVDLQGDSVAGWKMTSLGEDRNRYEIRFFEALREKAEIQIRAERRTGSGQERRSPWIDATAEVVSCELEFLSKTSQKVDVPPLEGFEILDERGREGGLVSRMKGRVMVPYNLLAAPASDEMQWIALLQLSATKASLEIQVGDFRSQLQNQSLQRSLVHKVDLPVDFEVEAVEGESVQSWWVEDRTLNVAVRPQTAENGEGETVNWAVRLRYDHSPGEMVEFAGLRFHEAEGVNGRILVTADVGHKPVLISATGVEPLEESGGGNGDEGLPWIAPESLAFSPLTGEFPRLWLVSEAEPTELEFARLRLLGVREDGVELQDHLLLSVKGPLTSWRFQTAKTAPLWEVSGTGLTGAKISEKGDHRLYDLLFDPPVTGRVRLILRTLLRNQPVITLPEVAFPAENTKGDWVALRNPIGRRIEVRASGMEMVEGGGHPFVDEEFVKDQATQVWKAGPDYSFSLLPSVALGSESDAELDQISLLTRLEPDGLALNLLRLRLLNRGMPWLRVRLPMGATPLSVTVSGKAVELRIEDGILLIPSPPHPLRRTLDWVEITWRQQVPVDAEGWVSLEKSKFPDLHDSGMEWKITTVPGYSLLDSESWIPQESLTQKDVREDAILRVRTMDVEPLRWAMRGALSLCVLGLLIWWMGGLMKPKPKKRPRWQSENDEENGP